jgi:hypothetical protein
MEVVETERVASRQRECATAASISVVTPNKGEGALFPVAPGTQEPRVWSSLRK